MIDIERMKGGADLAKELADGKSTDLPWMVVVDGDGKKKITSDGPKGNIGCPVDPHEVAHFLAMIDATRTHMSDDDRAIIERELRGNSAAILHARVKVPGKTEYSTAKLHVKSGHFVHAVHELGRALVAGGATGSVLTDASMRPLREDPDRRLELIDLLKKHATGHSIKMVDTAEPGRRIRLVGQVVDMKTGAPLPDALMQLFHTDATGEYRPGMDAGGGAGNPRLFGFL